MIEPGAVAIRWPSKSQGDATSDPSNSATPVDPIHTSSPRPPHATLLEWYVGPGERIQKDQELLLGGHGDTFHSLTSPVSGTLLVQWSETGETMGHGETLGWIRPDTGSCDS
ncbi:MAG: hypothetical protein AAEJ04_08490 [Planctomycetota bacterium]